MPQPSIRELAERLIASCGDVVGDVHATATRRWALVQTADQTEPVTVSVHLLGLERYIASAFGDGAHEVFPDVDETTAAWRLASVNLWEQLASSDSVVLEIGLNRLGDVWRRDGDPVSPVADLPPGDYRWSAGT